MSKLSLWKKSTKRPREDTVPTSSRPLERMEAKALLATLHVGTGHEFATIQATPSTRQAAAIRLPSTPGTYTEQVTIPASLDNLTLRSTKPGEAVIQAPATSPAARPSSRTTGPRARRSAGSPSPGRATASWRDSSSTMADRPRSPRTHITNIQDDPFSGASPASESTCKGRRRRSHAIPSTTIRRRHRRRWHRRQRLRRRSRTTRSSASA